MLSKDEVKKIILGKMTDAGFNPGGEGVKSGILADLLAEVVDYIVKNNEVKITTSDGKDGVGKFS
jgi:hypothetical protein